MPQEPLSAEAVALQSIAKSLDTIAKSLVSMNKLMSTIALSSLTGGPIHNNLSGRDSSTVHYFAALNRWRERTMDTIEKRFGLSR